MIAMRPIASVALAVASIARSLRAAIVWFVLTRGWNSASARTPTHAKATWTQPPTAKPLQLEPSSLHACV